MCGIAGFIGQDKEKIISMLDSINHRGPDDRGIFIDDNVTLGHVRLSILDLSENGHQPMEFDNLVMVYNGEVYNFKSIREELIKYGYSFKSQTDSEVILKAYHKWGIKAVDKFIGMFAIAIYDKNKKELMLIRDRVGVKPLYYYFDGKKFIFASEIRAIEANLQLNKKSLYEFFQYGYISSPFSIFENCFKLLPGHYLKFNLNDLKLEIKEYWSILPFFQKPKFNKTEKELIDELEELLIDAFSLRMVSDVPVGVFLSGGIDSSIVAAILQKKFGNIHTFTIGFNEAQYNEADWAKKVASYLGTNHTEKYLSSNEAKDILEKFVDIYDEPFGDSSGIPTTLVSRLAKENGVKVVLSADGGDEVFCGYSRYWLSYNIGKKIFKLPYFLRNSLANIMDLIGVDNASKLFKIKNFAHKYNQLTEMLKEKEWKEFYETMLHSAKNYEIMELVGLDSSKEMPSFKIGEKIHPMQGMMLWDYHRYLPDDILVKVDRATMYNSIEGREPLLDHRIAEFMAQVPFEYKYKNGNSKYLLRKVLERYLPKELIDRPKMGFGIPMFEWFSKDLNYLFEESFKEDDEIINMEYVRNQYAKLKDNKPININLLWFVLVYKMWKRKYYK